MSYQFAPSYDIDILIVGAGPIGLVTALWFGQKGYRVVVVERYTKTATSTKRSFNSRHQQVGINPTSLEFLRTINAIVWGKIKNKGCPQGDWINIPIYLLQTILYKEIITLNSVKLLFEAEIEAVKAVNPHQNARVIVGQGDGNIYSFYPELVVVADGRHDGRGVAKKFFNFPAACKVTLSTYGVIGLMERDLDGSTICLQNYSSDNYLTEYGPMHVRLLGSLRERYIALGVADSHLTTEFQKLTPLQIHDLLKKTYQDLRDPNEPEFTGFSEYSKRPIDIVLDYRKETIKLFEGSNTIVSVEGDAARKTTFFSGSGLNSGYQALRQLFRFVDQYAELIFGSQEFVEIDAALLEKDRAALEVSLELLRKGINFIVDPVEKTTSTSYPTVDKISPSRGEAGTYIQIKGQSLIYQGQPPKILFEWLGNQQVVTQVISNPSRVSVKVPTTATGLVSLSLIYDHLTVKIDPKFEVVKITQRPTIIEVKRKDESYYQVKGTNFSRPAFASINDGPPIKTFCASPHTLKFSTSQEIKKPSQIVISTNQGQSNRFILN